MRSLLCEGQLSPAYIVSRVNSVHMVSRKEAREKAAKIKESVAGTVTETKEKIRQKVANQKQRKELANFRSGEVTDQERARIQRAKAQAEQEAEKEARQEFVKEYQEELKEEVRKQKLSELRERNQNDSTQQSGPSLFGGGNNDFQPQLPPTVAPAASESPANQTEARVMRVKKQAQKEGVQSARQKFLSELRGDVKEDVQESELERLKRQFGQEQLGQSQKKDGEPRGALDMILGPPDDDDNGQNGPQLPGIFPEDDGNREPELPFRF